MNIIYIYLEYIFNFINNFSQDFGISIILITLLIKIVLFPINLKQKKLALKQQTTFTKINAIKNKYKNNTQKINDEMKKMYTTEKFNILVFLIPIMQLPILYTLYRIVSKIPDQSTSYLLPWISNLKIADPYYILPIFLIIIQLLPNFLATIGSIKTIYFSKLTLMQLIIVLITGIFFFVKAPVALSLYMIISNFITYLEQIIFIMINSKKNLIT